MAIACIAVLLGILVAGLWPFHTPKNEVTWLKDRNGLRFGDYGTVRSTDALDWAGRGTRNLAASSCGYGRPTITVVPS